MTTPMGYLPKPQPGWPTWAVWLYWIVVGIIVAGFLVTLAWKSVKIVPRGHAGMRTRYGRPRRNRKTGEWYSVPAGIYLVIPGTDSIVTVSIQDQVSTLELPNVEQQARPGVLGRQVAPYARWVWYVPYTPQALHDAIFRSSELEQTGTSFVMGALADAIEAAASPFDKQAISRMARHDARKDLKKYGIKTRELILVSTPRTFPQVMGDMLGKRAKQDAAGVAAATAAAAMGSGSFEVIEGGIGAS